MEPDTGQSTGQASPLFVVEKDGCLYVALAVLEYNEKAQDMTREQEKGVKEMREMFEQAVRDKELRAGQLAYGGVRVGPVQTGPGPVQTKPAQEW